MVFVIANKDTLSLTVQALSHVQTISRMSLCVVFVGLFAAHHYSIGETVEVCLVINFEKFL